MAPLPSNNTDTLFVDYTVGGEEHTIQCRFGASAGHNDAIILLDDMWTGLGDLIYLITITAARVRDQGTNVTYPVAWTGAATYGVGAAPRYTSAWFVDFVGRSIDGRRCRISTFGCKVVADTVEGQEDYRLAGSADARVAAALVALDAGNDTPVSISGQAVNFHQYANIGVNAYWRNRIR